MARATTIIKNDREYYVRIKKSKNPDREFNIRAWILDIDPIVEVANWDRLEELKNVARMRFSL